MNRRIMLTALSILFLLILTGCWSRKELNHLAIASAIGIDKYGDEYRVSVQIVVPNEVASKKGGGYETPVMVYSTTARTVFEAVRKMTTVVPRKIYLAHLHVIVFGEALAREGIGPVLDFLARNNEIREEAIYPLISRGTNAEETLKILTHLNKIPALQMYGSLRTLEKHWAPTTATKLDDVLFDLITSSKQPTITGIKIEDGKTGKDSKKNVESPESPSYLKLEGTAVFRKDKLIGWLDETESKGYNYIANKVDKTAEVVSCSKGGILSLDVIRTKTKLTGEIRDGKPQMNVAVRMEANLADLECKMDLTDPKVIDRIQEKTREQLHGIIEKSLDKIQHEYKADIFGFEKVLYQSNPEAWRKIRKDWNEIFPNVPVKVVSDIKIRNMGTMGNSVQNESEE
jgi:spore germination protein KC